MFWPINFNTAKKVTDLGTQEETDLGTQEEIDLSCYSEGDNTITLPERDVDIKDFKMPEPDKFPLHKPYVLDKPAPCYICSRLCKGLKYSAAGEFGIECCHLCFKEHFSEFCSVNDLELVRT